MTRTRPNRVVGGPHDEFWAWCQSDELRVQRCDRCQHFSWPPTESCENCHHDQLTWQRLSGSGRLISWCTFEHRYYEELPVPWPTIVVELDEGPVFISNPEGFSTDAVVLGTPVQLAFVACEDGHGPFKLPVFTLA